MKGKSMEIKIYNKLEAVCIIVVQYYLLLTPLTDLCKTAGQIYVRANPLQFRAFHYHACSSN